MKKLLRFGAWLAAAAAAVFLVVQLTYMARLWWWRDHNPETTAFMSARLEQIRNRDPGAVLRQAWIPYARLSPHLKRAIVVA